jgi:hypothetical protein
MGHFCSNVRGAVRLRAQCGENEREVRCGELGKCDSAGRDACSGPSVSETLSLRTSSAEHLAAILHPERLIH